MQFQVSGRRGHPPPLVLGNMGIPTMGFRVGSNKNKLKFPQYSLYLEIGWLQIL
jgi:hypothetical protein